MNRDAINKRYNELFALYSQSQDIESFTTYLVEETMRLQEVIKHLNEAILSDEKTITELRLALVEKEAE